MEELEVSPAIVMPAASVMSIPAEIGDIAFMLAIPYSNMAPPHMKFVPAAPKTSRPGLIVEPVAAFTIQPAKPFQERQLWGRSVDGEAGTRKAGSQLG